MIDPKPGDEGKAVHYVAHDGHKENGFISSWTADYVFVRYTSGQTAAATLREQLLWGHSNWTDEGI